MKKFIIGLILGCLISSAFAYNREELYRRFGPKLIEAIVSVIRDEINILRVKAGLPERTTQDIESAISNKLDNTKDYEWMKNRINER
jgi:hypothetical protein